MWVALKNSVTARGSRFVRVLGRDQPNMASASPQFGANSVGLGLGLDVEVRFRLKLVPLVLGE